MHDSTLTLKQMGMVKERCFSIEDSVGCEPLRGFGYKMLTHRVETLEDTSSKHVLLENKTMCG